VGVLFDAYIGIDYSGAETPESNLPGLRVYEARAARAPAEIGPPPGPRKHWTRRALAGWLIERLGGGERVLVGIDHAFSFPRAYFERHRLPLDWDLFLDDFVRHWPTDEEHTYVDFLRERNPRSGNARWRRAADVRARAKSVFHFDVPGQVAKSTHAGLPWLRAIRRRTPAHGWPLDGWRVPAGRPVVAEVYPALWSRSYPRGDRTPDQHDAYAVAAVLRDLAPGRFEPELSERERDRARYEGWILGL